MAGEEVGAPMQVVIQEGAVMDTANLLIQINDDISKLPGLFMSRQFFI
jgi:uncharacterized membrane protein YdfJ with MMPL/SSD domain